MSDENKKVLIPTILRNHVIRTLPTITAEDIIGVQPMVSYPKYYFSPNKPLEVRLSHQLLTTEFKDWCNENKLEIVYGDGFRRIIFPSEKEKAWFLLRWT